MAVSLAARKPGPEPFLRPQAEAGGYTDDHAEFAQPLRPARRCVEHATVLDDFIDRIMVDPRLNANPRVDEAQ